MQEARLQDVKIQAMMNEFQQQRILTGNQFGDRCVELAGAFAVAKKQAEDAQTKVVELTEEIRKLKSKKKPQQDEVPK